MTSLQVERPTRSWRNTLFTTALLAIGTLGLVGVVLPAGLNIDPLGIGEVTGLGGAAELPLNEEQVRGARRTGVLTTSDQAPQRDTWNDQFQITLGPYEGIELKYNLDRGDAIDFAWTAGQPVEYDLHSHPLEGGPELTESYAIDSGRQMQGRYVAAFAGLHGWYWQNRNLSDVTITLRAAGPIKGSTLFQAGAAHDRALTPP